MGYPAAYRRGALGSGVPGRGFQPAPVPGNMPAPYSNPGWRPPPKPANDNLRRLMRLARLARRLSPFLTAADLVMDYVEWSRQTDVMKWNFPAPWTKKLTCFPGPPYSASQWNWADVIVKSCQTGQASNATMYQTPWHVFKKWPGCYYMIFEYKAWITALNTWRSATREVWQRPYVSNPPDSEKPYPDTRVQPVPDAPHEVPWSPPAYFPEVPPLRPTPMPQPIPYPEVPYRPYPEVVHGPDRGYYPGVRSPTRPRPTPAPGWNIEPTPKPQPVPTPKPPPVQFLPDAPAFPRMPVGRGTKERKVMSDQPGYGELLRWARRYEHALDGRDVVEAVHDALPKKFQTKSKRLQDRLQAIYEHINDLDVAKALENVMKEIAEDKAGGMLDKLRGKAAKGLGVTKQQIRTYPGL